MNPGSRGTYRVYGHTRRVARARGTSDWPTHLHPRAGSAADGAVLTKETPPLHREYRILSQFSTSHPTLGLFLPPETKWILRAPFLLFGGFLFSRHKALVLAFYPHPELWQFPTAAALRAASTISLPSRFSTAPPGLGSRAMVKRIRRLSTEYSSRYVFVLAPGITRL